MATRHTIARLSERVDLLTRKARPPLSLERLTDAALIKALAKVRQLRAEAPAELAACDNAAKRYSDEELLQCLLDCGALTLSDFQ